MDKNNRNIYARMLEYFARCVGGLCFMCIVYVHVYVHISIRINHVPIMLLLQPKIFKIEKVKYKKRCGGGGEGGGGVLSFYIFCHVVIC